VPAKRLGRLTAGIAGGLGTGSAGVFALAAFRLSWGHAAAPGAWSAGAPGAWGAAAALALAGTLTGSLGLVLGYRLRSQELRAATDLTRTRLDMHRVVMEKAAGEPASARSYRELILADAVYLSVEQNRARLPGQARRHLYGRGQRRHRAELPGPARRGHVTDCLSPGTNQCQPPRGRRKSLLG
jgi:hypothetical protein